jgi:protein-tyrosine phosphatase
VLARVPGVSVPGFVDVHCHLVPSGDDGVWDVDEGLELCRQAAEQGTRLLFGTPHAHIPSSPYPLTAERIDRAREAYEEMKDECSAFGLELRLGWEVAPGGMLVGEVDDYGLEGTGAVLVEFPGPWFEYADPVEAVRVQVEQIRAAGLGVVLAHPERSIEIQRRPELVVPFAEDGGLICFNADSFLGWHGSAPERCAWQLLELGVGDLIASDAHGPGRPSKLREAFEVVAVRIGLDRALGLVDGSALGRLDVVDEIVT